jgi:hypothetical protein
LNTQLIALLKTNMGLPLTWDLAADIYVTAGRLETLVTAGDIEQVKPMVCDDMMFARERMEDIVSALERDRGTSAWTGAQSGLRHIYPL